MALEAASAARQIHRPGRHGATTDAWWRFSLTPVIDGQDVRGVFAIGSDVTEAHLDRERVRQLNALRLPIEARDTRDQTGGTRPAPADSTLQSVKAELAQQVFDWQRLQAMSAKLLEAPTLNDQLGVVLRTVARFLRCSQGAVWLYQADAGSLVNHASVGLSEEGLKKLTQIVASHSACRTAFHERRRVVVENTESDPLYGHYQALAQSEGFRSIYSLPLHGSNGQTIGVLSVYSQTPAQPDESQLRLVDICTAQVAIFVERARAEALARRERIWSDAILESISEGFILLDQDFRILQINSAGLQLSGTEREALIGQSHWDAWPGTEPLMRHWYEQALETGRPVSLEQVFPARACDQWFEIHLYPTDKGLAIFFRDVTQRKIAEFALRDSEKSLHQLANAIPQLAWRALPDGTVHWYNDRWYEYTGTSPEEMLAKGWQHVQKPESLPTVFALWRHSLRTGQMFQMTLPLRGADGVYRNFFTLVSPLRDETGKITQWFGTNTDVSALQHAEHALRLSEERLQEGLLAGRMAVWDWDFATDRTDFSRNAAAILGAPWETARQGFSTILPEDRALLNRAINVAIQQASQFRQVVRVRRPDNGEIVWIDIHGKVLVEDGQARSMRCISIDATERMRAEEELQQANKRKDEFLAMLAHELRNPLAPISTAAQLLRRRDSKDEVIRKCSEIISRQVDHMTSLVNDLLDVSRVTRGLVALDMAPLEFGPVVNSAIEQVRPLIESRGHSLELRMQCSSACVCADRNRLVQVVTNLLNNAAKYTPHGGRIILTLEAAEGQVHLSVCDNGMGIEPSLLPRVFDLFEQGERTPDRSQGGLGLGLALVKSLVELHGGIVEATSSGPGRGSTFALSLPLSSAPAEEPEDPCSVLPDVGQGLRLMVVDDNVDAARTLAELLSSVGHEVVVKTDGKGALEHCGEMPQQAFILDIGLPDLNGYELARRLRSRPENANATFIALTGYGQSHDRILSKAAGFDHHFVKPVDARLLDQILGQIRAPELQNSPAASKGRLRPTQGTSPGLQ
ncbi:MAG: PAS domain-containing protein [Pseudomonadota bacterium]